MMPLTDIDSIDTLERDEALATLADTARNLVHERNALQEHLKASSERADAWRSIAMQTREKYGEALERLGSLCGILEHIANSRTPFHWLLQKVRSVEEFVDSCRVDVPECLNEELKDDECRRTSSEGGRPC
jgi:hypothetical protein